MPTFNQFQQFVVGLLSPQTVETKETQLVNGILGLNGEAGEVADAYKKARFHGGEVDKHKLALELGDILFYVSSTADALGYTMEDIALLNMQKLTKRYPSGKFTAKDSVEKKDQKIGFSTGNMDVPFTGTSEEQPDGFR